ncbi:28S ribosomal protein S35, mitochondrial [Ascosphaera acerosa]|nr:28S ribosomal protein S35, mitochondrial [Ascosphaera acerosa]
MASIARPFARAANGLVKHPGVRPRLHGAFLQLQPPPARLVRPLHQARRLLSQEGGSNGSDAAPSHKPGLSVPAFSPDILTPKELEEYNTLTPEQRKEFAANMDKALDVLRSSDETSEALAAMERDLFELEREVDYPTSLPRARPEGFWAEDEEDEFARAAKDGDDHFNDDDITTMAHTELDAHRDVRHYARIAAWEMPLLSKFAKPFEVPPPSDLLRFRYTTYMGESHPAQEKVVVELCPSSLVPTHLTNEQRDILLKLAGPRYNPSTDVLRMSCEKFSTRAQNKRYLLDLVNTLLQEARSPSNMAAFKDLPLDVRHHSPRPKLEFPAEWALTEQRRAELAELRRTQAEARAEANVFAVDGNEVVADALPRAAAAMAASTAPTTAVGGRGGSIARRR